MSKILSVAKNLSPDEVKVQELDPRLMQMEQNSFQAKGPKQLVIDLSNQEKFTKNTPSSLFSNKRDSIDSALQNLQIEKEQLLEKYQAINNRTIELELEKNNILSHNIIEEQYDQVPPIDLGEISFNNDNNHSSIMNYSKQSLNQKKKRQNKSMSNTFQNNTKTWLFNGQSLIEDLNKRQREGQNLSNSIHEKTMSLHSQPNRFISQMNEIYGHQKVTIDENQQQDHQIFDHSDEEAIQPMIMNHFNPPTVTTKPGEEINYMEYLDSQSRENQHEIYRNQQMIQIQQMLLNQQEQNLFEKDGPQQQNYEGPKDTIVPTVRKDMFEINLTSNGGTNTCKLSPYAEYLADSSVTPSATSLLSPNNVQARQNQLLKNLFSPKNGHSSATINLNNLKSANSINNLSNKDFENLRELQVDDNLSQPVINAEIDAPPSSTGE